MFCNNGQHPENKTVAWGLIHEFREEAVMKHSNGNLGGGYFYSVRVGVIKGSGFVNSISRDQSELQTAVRDSSERFSKQTSLRRSSMYELL
jgi:hypothetical protein